MEFSRLSSSNIPALIATSIYTANKRFPIFLQLAGGKFSKFELKLLWEQEATQHLFPLLCSGAFVVFCSTELQKKANFHILYQQKYILSSFTAAGTRQQFSLTSILGAIDENIKNYWLSKRRHNATTTVFSVRRSRAEREAQVLPLLSAGSSGCVMFSRLLIHLKVINMEIKTRFCTFSV